MFSRLAFPSSIKTCVMRSASLRFCSGVRPGHPGYLHVWHKNLLTISPTFYREFSFEGKCSLQAGKKLHHYSIIAVWQSYLLEAPVTAISCRSAGSSTSRALRHARNSGR